MLRRLMDCMYMHAAAAAQLMATKYFSRIRLLGARNAVLFGLFCMLTLNVRLSLRSGTQRQVSWWIYGGSRAKGEVQQGHITCAIKRG